MTLFSPDTSAVYILATLTWPDWLVVVVFGVLIVTVGVYCAKKQTDLKEYFTASGNMGSLVVGISLYATLLSTISYLATPGEIIKHGPAILCILLSLPIVYIVVGYVLIPSIMRYRVTSAYEILEQELGKSVRTLGAVMFVCLRLVWMGLILYMSARALVLLLGWDDSVVPWLVTVIGFVSIVYTAIGGLRAVILTDVFQFMALLIGALLAIGVVTWWLGGVTAWWPRAWVSTWDRPLVFSLDPRERISMIGAVILGTQWWICTAGSDQTVIQRYMAVRDARAARRSFLINAVATVVITGSLALVGLALLGLYNSQPDLLPSGWTVQQNADELFPYFIGEQLPVGIAGLVLAGLFAAGMSSIDSGVNAVAAVMMSDLAGWFRGRKITQPEQDVVHAKYLVCVIGLITIGVGLAVGQVPGNFLEVSQKLTNLLVAPLFGLFFMALYVSWATPYGTLVGAMYGIGTAILVAFWDVLTGHEGLGFQWIGLYSLMVQIAVGCLASLFKPRSEQPPKIYLLVAILPLIGVYLAALLGLLAW
jgi:solute:Na+ symporter, SSS family